MGAEQTRTLNVDVHHITRVEGHGNIVVNVQDGRLVRCELEIVEAPRFFEALLCNQPYEQASHLASRICGICAVTHATTSLRACEKALGIQPSEQTVLLRKLNLNAEMLDSHILHAYMLVAPDLLGAGSVVPLTRTAPELVLRALRMKKVAGDICAAIGGRHTHPISMTVGGFTILPCESSLELLLEQLETLRPDLDATVELFAELEMPEFERETEYLALIDEQEYCLIDGEIESSDGGTWKVENYKAVVNEHLVDHSTAKHAKNQREAYMVGALSRFKLNHRHLNSRALAAASAMGLDPATSNPYNITIAQIVELVQCHEQAIGIIQKLLEKGIRQEDPIPPERLSGEGIGACEAPRGTLYHHYSIKEGLIKEANCVIPTAQNLANIEADMRALVPQRIDCTEDEITKALEMLVRAYDPCISCSTHMLEVTLVGKRLSHS